MQLQKRLYNLSLFDNEQVIMWVLLSYIDRRVKIWGKIFGIYIARN